MAKQYPGQKTYFWNSNPKIKKNNLKIISYPISQKLGKNKAFSSNKILELCRKITTMEKNETDESI